MELVFRMTRARGVAMPARFADFYWNVGAKKTVGQSPVTSGSAGAWSADSGGFTLGLAVSWAIYAYHTVASQRVYSEAFYVSSVCDVIEGAVTVSFDSDVFEAEGFLVTRDYSGVAATEWRDIGNTNSFNDDFNTGWIFDPPALPTSVFADAGEGDGVAKLEDQSGNARHLTQANPANLPVVSSDALTFDNADELLSAAFASQAAMTVFLVINFTSKTEAQSGPLGLSSSNDSFLVNATSGGNWQLRSGSGPAVLDIGAASTGAKKFLCLQWGANVGTLYIDGGTAGTGSQTGFASTLLRLTGGKFSFYALVAYNTELTPAQRAFELARLQSL